MADVIVALIVFAIIFVAITSGAFAFAVIMGLLAVVMFMPTQDGIFYSCIFENIKFLFAKKVYTENADKQKERVDALLNLKDIKENGLIEYSVRVFRLIVTSPTATALPSGFALRAASGYSLIKAFSSKRVWFILHSLQLSVFFYKITTPAVFRQGIFGND